MLQVNNVNSKQNSVSFGFNPNQAIHKATNLYLRGLESDVVQIGTKSITGEQAVKAGLNLFARTAAKVGGKQGEEMIATIQKDMNNPQVARFHEGMPEKLGKLFEHAKAAILN